MSLASRACAFLNQQYRIVLEQMRQGQWASQIAKPFAAALAACGIAPVTHKDPQSRGLGNISRFGIDSLEPRLLLTTLYWDANGATPGLGGTGTWDTSSANWTTDPTGSSTPVTWESGADAIISGTAGTVTLASSASANSLTLNNGTLSVSSAGSLNLAAGGTVSSGTTFNNYGSTNVVGTLNVAGIFYNGNPGQININNGGTLTVSSSLGNYGGTITINSGGSLATSSGSIFSGMINGTINISGGSLSVGGTFNNGGMLAETINLSAGSMTLQSGSQLTNYNSMGASSINISGGMFTVSNGATLTNNTGASVTVSGGQLNVAGTLANSGTLSTSGIGILQIGDGTTNSGSLTGNLVDNGSLVFATPSSQSVTYSGIISGSGSISKTNSGSTTLSGVNTFTGSVMVVGGSFAVAGGGALKITGGSVSSGTNFTNYGTTTLTGLLTAYGSVNSYFSVANLNINSGGTLVLNGTTGILSVGQGKVTINTGGALTLVNGGHVSNFAGGTVTLAGGAVTVDGNSTFSNGIVMVGGGNLTITSGTLAVHSNGQLSGSYFSNIAISGGTVTIDNGGSSSVDSSSSLGISGSGQMLVYGTLTNSGSLTNSNLLTNYGTVNNTGTLTNFSVLNNYGLFNTSGTLTSPNMLYSSTINNYGTINQTGSFSSQGYVNLYGTGIWNLNTNATAILDGSGAVLAQLGTLTINSTSSFMVNNGSQIWLAGTINVAGGALSLSNSKMKIGRFWAPGFLNVTAGTVALHNLGEMDIGAEFNGSVIVSGGTMVSDHGSYIPINARGTLSVSGNNTSVVIAGTLSGTSSSIISTSSGGTLQVGDGLNYSGALTGDVTNNGALIFAIPSAQSLTYSGALSGNGTLTKNGAGILVTNSTVQVNSNLTMNSGTIISHGDLIIATGAEFDNNGTWILPAGTEATVTLNGSVKGNALINNGTLHWGSDNVANLAYVLNHSSLIPADAPSLPTGFDTFIPTINATDNAPQINNATKTAQPDESLTVTAEDMSSGTTTFWAWGQTNASNGTLSQITPAILDSTTQVAQLTLPTTLPSDSMYLLWAQNGSSAGYPVAVNKTETWWVGPDAVAAGQTVSVFGRNLTYGGTSSTQSWVYIKAPGNVTGQWVTVNAANPYKVDFVVPAGLINGTYEVWVHNGHGGNYGWSAPVSLTVQNTQVWSDEVINVADYGAIANDTNDDRTAIKNALDAAKALATFTYGVTVQLNAGNYILSETLSLPSHVRFVGAGKNATTLQMILPNRPASMLKIDGKSDVVISDMTLDANHALQTYIYGSGVIQTSNTVNNLTLANLKIQGGDDSGVMGSYGLDIPGQTNNLMITDCDIISHGSWIAHGNQVVVDGCNFYGVNDANSLLTIQGQKLQITNSTGQDYDNNNAYGWASGRFVVFSTIDNAGSCINVYMGNNTTTNLGVRNALGVNQNAGEQILWELGNNLQLDSSVQPIIAANSTSVKIDNTIAGLYNTPRLMVAVVKGQGLGQIRSVSSIDADGTVHLDSPWSITPDLTSRINIVQASNNTGIYSNNIDGKENRSYDIIAHPNASAGFQPWSTAFNLIIDNNDITDVGAGLSIWSNTYTYSELQPSYYNIYINNTVTNSGYGAVIRCKYEPTDTTDDAFLGNIFRSNNFTAVRVGFYLDNIVFPAPFVAMIFEHNTLVNDVNFDTTRLLHSDGSDMVDTLYYANTLLSVATPANPGGIVIGETHGMSVLGFSSDDESSLTYTWSVVSQPVGATVTFSQNDSNAAKSTEVSLSLIGNYTLRATILDSVGHWITSDVVLYRLY